VSIQDDPHQPVAGCARVSCLPWSSLARVWRGASGGILVPFAISMDYTVFLLSSAKVHWDHIDDAREAMIGGIAHSGRVIFAAAAVMVAVFFTFALSGPLPPKEMGIILSVAVLLDATLIRLLLLLLPVLLRLMGARAWYLPRWARRVLPDVRFGHS